MIVAEEVMDLMLAACPSFAAVWDPMENVGESGERLLYLEAADFCRHLTGLVSSARTEELADAFSLIERLHIEGDPWVLNLAIVGFLESLLGCQGIEPWLQPASARWWDRLDRYWQGDLAALAELDQSRVDLDDPPMEPSDPS